ncbi:MAG: SDR family NAD(P)-dependent oxidoreductase [Acidimicrobiales bacterium]
MARLSGVRAVVTGATSGLGAAMADALLGAGASVAFASRPTERLDAAVARRRAAGLAAQALPMDVRDAGSVESAADRAGELLGGVDLVVNNAGIGMRTVNPRFFEHPMAFFEVPPDRFADVVATNLTGYFLVARAFAPELVARGSGRIVNVTMNHETMCRPGFVPYGPARAGAESLSRIMTEDLRPHGVAVNLLLPGGATATGMIPERLPEEARQRLLPPEVMGPPIVFLASADAEGLTGKRIVAKDFDQWLAGRAGARDRGAAAD